MKEIPKAFNHRSYIYIRQSCILRETSRIIGLAVAMGNHKINNNHKRYPVLNFGNLIQFSVCFIIVDNEGSSVLSYRINSGLLKLLLVD